MKFYYKSFLLVMVVLVVLYAYKLGGTENIQNDDEILTPPTVVEKDNDNKEDALSAAESIVSENAISRYDLYYKLLFMDFTEEAIMYAVENVDVDWKEECVEFADYTVNKGYFSESELIFKLSDVCYDREEIDYALDTLNIDWKAEAVQCANACKDGGFSPVGLRQNFYTIGFDKELVDYALSTVDIDYVYQCEVRISYFMDMNDYNEEDTRWELKYDGFDEETINKAFENRNNKR